MTDDRLLGVVSETDPMSRGAYPTAPRRHRVLGAEVVVEAAVRHVPHVVDVVNEVVAQHPTPSVRDVVGRPR